jgi:hypothetical protein
MKQALIYSLKVWLTSIPLAIVLIIAANYLIRGIKVHLQDTPLGFGGLLVGSLPSIVVFLLCSSYLDIRLRTKQVVLACLAFILSAAPFIVTVWIMKYSMKDTIIPSVGYGLITALCSLFYKLKPSKQ